MGELQKMKATDAFFSVDAANGYTDAGDDAGYEAADVTIEGEACHFSAFEEITGSARKLLSTGLKWGFSLFPINRNTFRNKIVSTHVTEKSVCNALTKSPNVDQSDHNAVRNKLAGTSLGEEKAWEMGVMARRIQVKKVCDDDYDYANSPVYAGVDDCADVLKEIDGHGIPVVMCVVDMEATAARTFIDKPSSAPLYTDYAGGKPNACGSGKQDGRIYKDSYHEIPVLLGLSIEFIMRVFSGKHWSAWNMRTECDGYEADDLKFNFGARVFVPITVDEGSGPIDRTIVITSVAAASNIGPVPDNIAYKRTVGAETAKKILMDAKGKGWSIN